jgi:hypothetical protein
MFGEHIFPIPLWSPSETITMDMSPRDILLCKSTELFIASYADAMWSSFLPRIVEDQVGLRCSYCAKAIDISYKDKSSSRVFPVSVEDVANCLRSLGHNHFTKCPSNPSLPSINENIESFHLKQLIDYCTMKCEKLHITILNPPLSGLIVRSAEQNHSHWSSFDNCFELSGLIHETIMLDPNVPVDDRSRFDHNLTKENATEQHRSISRITTIPQNENIDPITSDDETNSDLGQSYFCSFLRRDRSTLKNESYHYDTDKINHKATNNEAQGDPASTVRLVMPFNQAHLDDQVTLSHSTDQAYHDVKRTFCQAFINDSASSPAAKLARMETRNDSQSVTTMTNIISRGNQLCPTSSYGIVKTDTRVTAVHPRIKQRTTIDPMDASYAFEHDSIQILPYFQEVHGFWVCRHCSVAPLSDRAIGSIWGARTTPDPAFMRKHLLICTHFKEDQLRLGRMDDTDIEPVLVRPMTSRQSDTYINFENDGRLAIATATSTSESNEEHMEQNCGAFHIQAESLMVDDKYETQGMTFQQDVLTEGQEYNPDEAFNHQVHPWNFNSLQLTEKKVNSKAKASMKAFDPSSIIGSINYLEDYERRMVAYLKKGGADVTPLVTDEDRCLISEFVFHILKQLRKCVLSETDQHGRGQMRSSIKVGFTGIQCNHCTTRKFFWTHVSRFNNSFSSEIISHVMSCCPSNVHNHLLVLKNVHTQQMLKLTRGSQKLFFEKLWSKLHPGNDRKPIVDDIGNLYLNENSVQEVKCMSRDALDCEEDTYFSELGEQGCFSFGSTTFVKAVFLKLSLKNISEKPILMALDEDYLYLNEYDCLIRNNIAVFCYTRSQADSLYDEVNGGIALDDQVGLKCAHCCDYSTEDMRNFPTSLDQMFEFARTIGENHLPRCPNLPKVTKEGILHMRKVCGAHSSYFIKKYYAASGEALGILSTSNGLFLSNNVPSDPN